MGADPILMTDVISDIARERAVAQAALAEAERRMKEVSRDAAAFRLAKEQRQEATEALERLEWAEKAERERQAAAAREERLARLQHEQKRARHAHEQAQAIVADLEPLLADFAQKVRELRIADSIIKRGAHFESFEIREGLLERPTISPNLQIDQNVAILALRVAREFVKLTNLNLEAAQMRAAQGSL